MEIRKNKALWLESSDYALCLPICDYFHGMFSHLGVCWFLNTNKSIRDSPSASCLLLFPIRFLLPPLSHLLVLSQSGTSDFVGTTRLRQRRETPEQIANTTPLSQKVTDSEIGPCARLHVMHDQFVGTCCFTC